ncbi:response regulator [Methanospirillum lacunae]|nr:response regulator [Methanospirillum lacunae]
MNDSKKDYSILIVEDDPIIARVLETILKDSGFSADEPVNSGEKAISRVAARKPGIVLMDIDLLGHISGIETARILFHIFNIPVIFVTGHDEEEVLIHAKEADPFGFLVKPINQNILNTTIQVSINLHEKLTGTTEGKTGGLTQIQCEELTGSLKPVVLLNDRNRIIWMNDAAEFLLEKSYSDLLLSDAPSLIMMEDPTSGESVDIFSLDPVFERPLKLKQVQHSKQVVPKIFMINDSFGDISGYFLELNPASE